MKRTRDDVRPSRGERYDRSQEGIEGAAGGRVFQRPTMADALSYVTEVDEAFQDHPEKYDMFVEIMKDFSTGIDRAGVLARAKELFKGHDGLIHGFNAFFPEGCGIAVDEPPVKKKKKEPATHEEALGFMNKVKERFRGEKHIYLSFSKILYTYLCGKKINAVYNEVADLFADHPDLLEAFERFLPENFLPEGELSSITTQTLGGLQMDWSQAEDEVGTDRADLDNNEDMVKKVHKDDSNATGSNMNR